MEIKTKKLINFLNKIKMGGTQQITECIWRFEPEGLKISATAETQQTRISGILYKSAFDEYKDIGNIGVNDFDKVIRVLQRFGESIKISKKGNLLMITEPGKKVDIELASEEFLEKDINMAGFEFKDSFNMNIKQLNNIINDVSMNTDAVVTITTEEKMVVFTNTGKYKFRNEILSDSKGGETVKFGSPLFDAVTGLKEDLVFDVKSDYPCRITEKTEESVVDIIVAPRVEED